MKLLTADGEKGGDDLIKAVEGFDDRDDDVESDSDGDSDSDDDDEYVSTLCTCFMSCSIVGSLTLSNS